MTSRRKVEIELKSIPASPHGEILGEIRRVFGAVSRQGGVSLHETEVIDSYGTPEERRSARRKDSDAHWWEVRDEWIEEFGGVGGLSFFDAIGFRYYLPAYMSYWLRKEREPNGLAFHLRVPGLHDFDKLFSKPEKVLIARFLNYVRVHFESKQANKALERFWSRYTG